MNQRRYRTILPLVALHLCLLAGTAIAQPGGGGVTIPTLPDGLSTASSGVPELGLESEPLEAPINPAIYRVGPNDIFTLQYEGGAAATPYTLRVTPDNQLVLPRDLGVIDVSGMTLAQLRTKVLAVARARTSSMRNPSLALIRARIVRVRVRGDVLNPGPQKLSAADRVSTAIEMANSLVEQLAPSFQAGAIQQSTMLVQRGTTLDGFTSASGTPLRTVQLRHNNGTSEEIDLMRYRLLGDDRGNPTLREGDEIIVESERSSSSGGGYVGISGAVQTSSTFRWRRGDNALMLARLSTGVREDGDPTRAELVRQGADGSITRMPINLEDSAQLVSLELLPGDQIVVPARTDIITGSRSLGVVTISGEVTSPGAYPITPGVTKLSELLRLAGGPTANAALAAGIVERDLPEQRGFRRENYDVFPPAYHNSLITLDDTSRSSRIFPHQAGRVSANIEAIAHGDTMSDIPLENGDRIIIPTAPRYVTVRGRVRFPGAVRYVAGATPDYYLERAGGVTEAADNGKIGVFRYGIDMWDALSDASIRPGDEIYVPGERDEPVRTSLEVASTYINIAGGIAGIANAIFQFVNSISAKQP